MRVLVSRCKEKCARACIRRYDAGPQMKRIAELQEGEFARIRGRIRRAAPELLLVAGERRVVYRDVRKDVHAEPDQREGQPFWVEDAHGDRVLIRPEAIRIVAGGEEQDTLVETATSDLQAVTSRIRVLKDELRETGGADKTLRSERKRLAKIATLLCAIRAHARGNVHASANLEEQQRFIDEHMGLIQSDGLGTATMKMMVHRLEVILQPDDPVQVEGVFRIEPMPPDVGGAQGYRERPVCWTLRDGDEPATLIGMGKVSPAQNLEEKRGAKKAKSAPAHAGTPSSTHPPPHQDPIVRATAVIVSAAVAVYYLFFH